ncbi:mitofusin [Sorochytrium milnesiophthora]
MDFNRDAGRQAHHLPQMQQQQQRPYSPVLPQQQHQHHYTPPQQQQTVPPPPPSRNLFAEMQGLQHTPRKQPAHLSYAHNRLLLLSLISDSQSMLRSLEKYGRVKRSLLYPLPAMASRNRASTSRHGSVGPSAGAEYQQYLQQQHQQQLRGHAMPSPTPSHPRIPGDDYLAYASNSNFTVLHLDIPLGSSPSMLPATTLTHLLSAKLKDLLTHLSHLHTRVEDNASRLLVTGDLNAGKSTFVNALLRRHLLPADQQPLTGVFTEVVDARHNHGVEEIHCVKGAGTDYSPDDPLTFDRCSMDDLYRLVTEVDEYKLIKVYSSDRHRNGANSSSGVGAADRDAASLTVSSGGYGQVYTLPHTPGPESSDDNSILNNDVVDVRIIDSPGLNRDMWKTMALFSRQKEIDVIVFVVSSENHFTLSGREFLMNAGKEKAYIFIVVNKFDLIRDKNRCRKLILQQIEQLSPHTYANAENLVHFVSSAELLNACPVDSMDAHGYHHPQPHHHPYGSMAPYPHYQQQQQQHYYGPGVMVDPNTAAIAHIDDVHSSSVPVPPDFQKLERALKEFTLEKRSISKLFPAKMFLLNLLADIDVLLNYNLGETSAQLQTLQHELSQLQPLQDKMRAVKEESVDRMDAMIASAAVSTSQVASARLAGKCLGELLTQRGREVEWHGILHAYDYVLRVKQRLLDELTAQLTACQTFANDSVQESSQKLHALANNSLWDYQPAPGAAATQQQSQGMYPSVVDVKITPMAMQDLDNGGTPSSVAKSLSTPLTTLYPLAFRVNFTGLVYEYRDKLSSMSLALTGCSFLATSMIGGLGSRALAVDAFRVGMQVGLKRVGSMAALSLGVFGTVTAYNLLSNLPHTLPHLLTRSLLAHLDATGYVATVSSYLGSATRITLSHTMVELTGKMDRAIVNVRDRQRVLTDDLSVSKESLSMLEAFRRQCHELEGRVEEVELDVGDSRCSMMVPLQASSSSMTSLPPSMGSTPSSSASSSRYSSAVSTPSGYRTPMQGY